MRTRFGVPIRPAVIDRARLQAGLSWRQLAARWGLSHTALRRAVQLERASPRIVAAAVRDGIPYEELVVQEPERGAT